MRFLFSSDFCRTSNYYDKFNVNREGLVLNNSVVAAQSQLGGLLMGNANLARTGSASLIVNEVTGATQSHINGFIEVHGRAADLVVANPNGISVNGGGFINAPKVTLTTGLPEFDANGALQSLLVQQGKVSIGERGMYIQNCSYCDILANAVEINGAIQGQKSIDRGSDIRVISGYYRFDYPSGTASEEGGGDPIMGVDSSALGGMYVGKIYFIAKGRDVGVKLPPNMATNTGDLVVESDGSIHLSGQLNSSGKIEIKTLNELVSQDMKIRTNDKINLSAQSVTMSSTDSFTTKTLSLNVIDGITSLNNKLRSVQALQIQGGSLESTGDQWSSLADISLESTTGAMTLKKAVLNSPQTISMQSEGDFALNGKLAAKQGIQLISQGGLQQTGILEASEGTIVSQTSDDSSVKGKWTARDGIRITSDQAIAINNHSLLSSESPIEMNAGTQVNLEGTIRSKEKIRFEGDNGFIQGEIFGKNIAIETNDNLQLKGKVYGDEQIQVKSGSIQMEDGILSGNQGVQLEATIEDLVLNNTEIESPMDIALIAAQDVSLSGSLKTNEEISVEGQQDVRMNALMQGHTAQLRAQRNLSVEPTSDVKVTEALALEATNDVTLQGQSQSGTLTLSGNTIHVAGQHVSQDKMTITAQDKAQIEGNIASIDDKIEVNGTQALEINGTLNSKNDLTLRSNAIEQKGALFVREGTLAIQGRDLNLSGQILGQAGIQIQGMNGMHFDEGLQMASKGLVTIAGNEVQLAGRVDANEGLVIQAATLGLKPQTELFGKSLSLSQTSEEAIQWNAITLNGEEKVSVKAPGDINFFGSVLSSGEVLFESEKSMDFRGTESKIEGKMTLKAKNRLSLSGFLLALSSVFLTADELSVQPQTQIESVANITIDAKNPLTIPENSSVLSKDLAIKSPSLTNKGVLQGSNSVDLNADRQLTNEGQILSEGNLTIETAQLQNNGILQGGDVDFNIANLSNTGGIWIAGPWTLTGDKATNTGWLRIDGPWTGKFNTFENLDGWLKGTSVDFKDPMRWLNKARMSFSGDVLLPQSTFENVSADFYSSGDVTLDTLRNVNEREPVVEVKQPNTIIPLYGGSPSHGSVREIIKTEGHFTVLPGKKSNFTVQKNLNAAVVDNSFSDLFIGEQLQIVSSIANRSASCKREKSSEIYYHQWVPGRRKSWGRGHHFYWRSYWYPNPNQPAPEILATAPSTIQVGGKIRGTVKSFMNGEAVAKDDTIKDNLGALPAYAETAWDKEKAALKVLREGGKDPIEKLRFAVPEVDVHVEVPVLGGMAMAALPPVEVARVEEDERTQLWRLQVQDFLDEVRAEPLVFNAKYDAPYVIETNPMYVDPGLFYGSQYFLDRVDLTSGGKPSIETRLGDAFFENQLIRQQIQAATNRFILSHSYANEAEQQLALYNNALEEARELGLKAGERLTPEQVKKLKRDLIWLETEEVDGKHVLVPRVYLCANTKSSLYTSASQVFAKSIDLQVEGDVLNQGLIEAEEDLSIQSGGTIANVAGKIATQKGDLSLQAEGNVLNISGEIASGNDLTISSKTIASTTTKQRMDGYKSHTDVLGATAKISAKNALHLAADEHLAAIGTSFKGQDITLASGGDMHLDVAEKTYHYRDGGGNWQINEHGAHALQTTIEANKNVHLLAQDDLKTRAVKVQAGGDFEVKSEQGSVTSEAFKDYDYAYYYSHHSGGFFGGSSTTETTSYVTHDIGSDIVAQETGTLSAEKDVHLKAGKVAAKDLTLESKSGKVKLEAGKDEDFYHHYHKSSGLITTSVDDEGHDRKVSKPVEILAQTVTVPSPAEIDYKAGLGKEFREALGGRTDIDWKAVQDHYREWSEHTTTLSGPARMLVACVLSVVTQGMGTSEWLAGHGIAEGTATNAALSSGIQTLAASAGTALATNLGDFSKAFDELTSAAALKNLTASILSAGLQLDTAASLPEATLKSAESLAIQTGLQNRKLGDILISDVVDAGAAQLAHGIGNAKATGALNQVTHKAAHGALAVTGAKLTGRDPVGAVIGAVVAETAAEAMDKPGASQEARQKIAQKARIIGDTAAFLAGRDVASADNAGATALENNFIIHDLDAVPPIDVIEENSEKPLKDQFLGYNQAVIEEGMKETQLWNETATVMAPYTTTGVVMGVGMGVPLVAKTAGLLGTAATAHYFGSIAADSGAKGLVQEAKDHPIMTTMAVMPFVPGPKVLKAVKGKTEGKSYTLTPYGGPGGGHHIHMKSAYKSEPRYNPKEALCLSNEEMERLGINHLKVSVEQRRLCQELQKAGKPMTREEQNRIAVQSLQAGGASEQMARDIVARSQWDLKNKAIRQPTDMPYAPKIKENK